MAFSWRRMIVGWLGLALLAAQLGVLPAFPVSAAPDAAEICGIGGMRHAGFPPAEGEAARGDLCVFCLPLMHSGSLAQPGETLLSLPRRDGALVARQPAWDAPPVKRTSSSLFARGPPAA